MKFDPQKKLNKVIDNIIKQFQIMDKIICKVLNQDKPAKKLRKKRRKSKYSA